MHSELIASHYHDMIAQVIITKIAPYLDWDSFCRNHFN